MAEPAQGSSAAAPLPAVSAGQVGPIPPQFTGVPLVYFNGFAVIMNADLTVILMVEGQPQLRLAMSLSTAKSLSEQIGKAVGKYEEITGSRTLKIEEVTELVRQAGVAPLQG